MLFAYTCVPHPMEKMQEFIEFIFFQVWCQAPGGQEFSFDLFNAKPELKAVMEAFHFSDARGADFFNGHVEKIFYLFAGLSAAQITQLQAWFNGNNDIAGLCRNDPAVAVARYTDLQAFHQPLSEALATFFKGLYAKDLLNLAALKAVIGEIDDHHVNFTRINRQGKCPFCGINDVKGIYHSKREAYDHYLPKGKYPFNSINFHNLAPACHECNSTYKLSRDPLNTAAGRRKAFYPYKNPGNNIEIKIDLKKPDVDSFTPDDIRLECGPAELTEEIETWKDIYGIEERYKAKCCSDGDGKYWLAQVLDEWQEDGRSPSDFLYTLTRQAARNPFADSNFLKKAFLEACDRIGLFNAQAEGA